MRKPIAKDINFKVRDLKFRAWDKENKDMTYGVDLQFDSNGKLSFLRHNNWQGDGEPEENVNWDGIAPIEEFVLMQYTGLKDKNSKDVYEGDIVKDFYGKILRIDWADKWARYMLSYDGQWCQYYLEDYHNNKTDYLAQSMEVIGNIYENPELLKEQ